MVAEFEAWCNRMAGKCFLSRQPIRRRLGWSDRETQQIQDISKFFGIFDDNIGVGFPCINPTYGDLLAEKT